VIKVAFLFALDCVCDVTRHSHIVYKKIILQKNSS